MTQAQPGYLNRLLDFWNSADAELAKRGEPPLTYERARELFDLELDPNVVPDVIVLAPVANEAHAPIAAKDLRMLVSRRLAELGINPFEAARRGGLERSFVNDILIGKKRSVRGDNIGKLAAALETDVVALLKAHTPAADEARQ